jgi:UDP-3-O-[3-hydroxymyristoyl] glucosamine N-acyltransferase
LDVRRNCLAGLLIVGPNEPGEHALEVKFPEAALATLTMFLAREPVADHWWPQEEVVGRFGEIARFARIHRDARIGEGTHLGAGVVLHAGVVVGSGCTLCDHVVLGSPGFGLYSPPLAPQIESGTPEVEPGTPVVELVETNPAETSPHSPPRGAPPLPIPSLLMPHRAGVHVGDDVFLGPHVNVASGLLEPTWIGNGCRIDALVQVGHNCRIGEGCVLAGQAGLAGSVELGAGCMVGGQAGFADHVRVGAGCRVAGQAGVTRSWPAGTALVGFPARPRGEWLREHAHGVPARRTHSSTFSPNVGT